MASSVLENESSEPAMSSIQKSENRDCSKTPDSITGCESPGSVSDEDTCPICLGVVTDKCVAGSCLHKFCFVCLKEWSKQKAVCPLCKLSFDKIIYNIKSESDYKEWKVPKKTPVEDTINVFREFFGDAESRRFFGYRTTNFPGSLLLRRRQGSSHIDLTDAIPSMADDRRRHRSNVQRGSSMFRRSVYLNNLWVNPMTDVTGRYREATPDLYREQHALTHRLVPWVNRELAALVSSSRIAIILSEIMDLIEQHPIDSEEFRDSIRHHLGARTNHFCHEFNNFAISPFDMIGHDNSAVYQIREERSDNDSDGDIVEVTSNGEPVRDITQNPNLAYMASNPSRVAREETIANDGSVVISSEESDADDSALIRNGRYVMPSANTSNDIMQSLEEPLSLQFMISRARNFLTAVDISVSAASSALIRAHITSSASGNVSEPGPSGISSTSSAVVKREQINDGNDSDECFVVDEVRAKIEHTPEIINLSSQAEEGDSVGGEPERSRKGRVLKKRYSRVELNLSNNPSSSDEQKGKTSATDFQSRVTRSQAATGKGKGRKTKKRPKLDRNKFSNHFEDRKRKTAEHKSLKSVKKRKVDGDHSYCSDHFENDCDTREDYSVHSNDNVKRDGDNEAMRNPRQDEKVECYQRSENVNNLSEPGCSHSNRGKLKGKRKKGVSQIKSSTDEVYQSSEHNDENIASSRLSTPSLSPDYNSDSSTSSDQLPYRWRKRNKTRKLSYDSHEYYDDSCASTSRNSLKSSRKALKREREISSSPSDNSSNVSEFNLFHSRETNRKSHIEKWVCKQKKYSYYYSDRYRSKSKSNSCSDSGSSSQSRAQSQCEKSSKYDNPKRSTMSDGDTDFEPNKHSKKKIKRSKSKKKSKDKRKSREKKKCKDKKMHRSKKKKHRKSR